MTAFKPPPIAMRERLRTDYQWTTRQRQVLDLMARGKSNAEIAETLGISLQGAKWHVSEVMSKLQSDSREEAADYWRRYNGIPPRFARVFRGLVGLSVVKWAGAATVAAIVAAGGIAIAVVASGGGDDLPSARATTTPGLLESLPSIAAGKEAVQATDPLAASLVESALRGDVDALLDTFPVTEGACEDLRGGRGVSRCELEGLTPGTTIKLYELVSESLPGFLVNEQTARDTISYHLFDRHPRLDLVARRDDGSYLAILSIDPQPDRLFPGGEIVGGDVGAVWLVVDRGGALLDFGGRSVSAPALEPIQNDVRQGVHTYEILGVSQEFTARDSRIHAELDALRMQSPP